MGHQPVPDLPALLCEHRGERIMAIADLHLGIEEQYRKAGAHIASGMERTAKKVLGAIKANGASRLVVVGDIKHSIPWVSLQEAREVPRFFEMLSGSVERIEMVLGNHDGDLRRLFTKPQITRMNIRFHADAFVLGECAFFHGHKWPPEKAMSKRYLVLSHNHPSVELPQGIGMSIYQPCWLRAGLIPERVKKHYPDVELDPEHEVIVMPAMLSEARGTAVNSARGKLLGPRVANGLVDVGNARVYLLDGTQLGRVKDLRASSRSISWISPYVSP